MAIEQALLQGFNVHDPQFRVAASPVGLGCAPGGKDERLAVGRPCGIEPLVTHPAWRLTGRPHDEDPAAVTIGAERDALAVRRELRVEIVFGRVSRQVDRVLSADALEEDVQIPAVAGHIEQSLPVRR